MGMSLFDRAGIRPTGRDRKKEKEKKKFHWETKPKRILSPQTSACGLLVNLLALRWIKSGRAWEQDAYQAKMEAGRFYLGFVTPV
jgi:hypothetical protein